MPLIFNSTTSFKHKNNRTSTSRNTISPSESNIFQRALSIRQLKGCLDIVKKNTKAFSTQLSPSSVLLIAARLLREGLTGRNQCTYQQFLAKIHEAPSTKLFLSFSAPMVDIASQHHQPYKSGKDPPFWSAGLILPWAAWPKGPCWSTSSFATAGEQPVITGGGSSTYRSWD